METPRRVLVSFTVRTLRWGANLAASDFQLPTTLVEQEGQPVEALLLVGAQFRLETVGHRLHLDLAGVQQSTHRPVPGLRLPVHQSQPLQFVPQAGLEAADAQGLPGAVLQPSRLLDQPSQLLEPLRVEREVGAAGQDHVLLGPGQCHEDVLQCNVFTVHADTDLQVEPVPALGGLPRDTDHRFTLGGPVGRLPDHLEMDARVRGQIREHVGEEADRLHPDQRDLTQQPLALDQISGAGQRTLQVGEDASFLLEIAERRRREPGPELLRFLDSGITPGPADAGPVAGKMPHRQPQLRWHRHGHLERTVVREHLDPLTQDREVGTEELLLVAPGDLLVARVDQRDQLGRRRCAEPGEQEHPFPQRHPGRARRPADQSPDRLAEHQAVVDLARPVTGQHQCLQADVAASADHVHHQVGRFGRHGDGLLTPVGPDQRDAQFGGAGEQVPDGVATHQVQLDPGRDRSVVAGRAGS
jgi:hypothetical protein